MGAWKRLGRVASLGVLLVAMLLTVASCGGSSSGGSSSGGSAAASPTGSPVAGGDLVFARPSDILSTDPTAIADNISIWAVEQMFETLYTVDQDGKGVHPDLATDYTLSPDKLTWTFTLRHGVKFSDGTPLTAEDVAFSINRARKSTVGFGYIDAAIKNVTAKDDATVVVTTKYPWAPSSPTSRSSRTASCRRTSAASRRGTSSRAPVGTGPFMFDTWTKGQSLKVVRNPNYWQTGKPYLDSVTFNNVPDDNTRALQLEGGQAEINMSPPFSSVDEPEGQAGHRRDPVPRRPAWT